MENQKQTAVSLPMMNPHEYWQALKREVSKKLPNITPAEINFKSSEPKIGKMELEQSVPKLTSTINDVFEIYFGKKKENVSEALKRAIIRFILDHFYMLTVEDIEFAFKRTEIEVKDKNGQYVPITVQSFCKYINQWFNVKRNVLGAKREIVQRYEDEQSRQIKTKQFEFKCIEKYREALSKGVNEWTEDILECPAISRELIATGKITEDEQQMLRSSAKNRRLEIEVRHEQQEKENRYKKQEVTKVSDQMNFLELISHTEDRIFAKLVVEYGLFNGIEL